MRSLLCSLFREPKPIAHEFSNMSNPCLHVWKIPFLDHPQQQNLHNFQVIKMGFGHKFGIQFYFLTLTRLSGPILLCSSWACSSISWVSILCGLFHCESCRLAMLFLTIFLYILDGSVCVWSIHSAHHFFFCFERMKCEYFLHCEDQANKNNENILLNPYKVKKIVK
jgi:hypothetical protein